MKKFLLAAGVAALLSGCTSTALNTGNQVNLADVDFKDTFKVGESCERTFLIFGPFGSSSVVDAAKSGGLSKVQVVEQSFHNYILVTSRCTKVHGKG